MPRAEQLVWFTRLGFAARGLLYLVIAWLVIGSGRSADLGGALEYLASGRERVLLTGVAAGFVAYGLWRLSDAALDSEGRGDDLKGIAGRIAAAGSGIIYLFLALQAWQLLAGNGGSSGADEEQRARQVLDLPAGDVLLAIGALILAGAGAWQLIKAGTCSFLKHLAAPVRENDWIRWLGRIGYAARGMIFLVCAFFLAEAALDRSASDAGGMQEALRWLTEPVSQMVAAGLGLFGIFSLIEARYRAIQPPPIDAIQGRANSTPT